MARCYICNRPVKPAEAINLGKVVIHKKWWRCGKAKGKS